MDSLNSFFDIDNFLELMSDLVFIKNLEGKYINCNKAFLNFVQLEREDVLNKTDYELFSKENAEEFTNVDREILETTEGKSYEETFVLDNLDKVYFDTTKKIIFDKNGEKIGLFCVAKNITESKQYEIIYEDNKSLLEFIAKEDDLCKTLKKIIYLSESRNLNSKCSIFFLDKSGEYLTNVMAPSLPKFYNEALKKIKVSPKAGSCGAAAYKREIFIVENIDEHKNWKYSLDLTKKANLHACWSQPIMSSNNELLGTFAIYNEFPKYPSDFELKLISSYAHLASVAIEKDKKYKLLKDKELLLLNQSRMASMEELLSNISHQWRQPLSIISTAASGIRMQKELGILDENIFNSSLDSVLESTMYLSNTLDTFRDYFKTNDLKEEFFFQDCFDKVKNSLHLSLIEKNISIIEDISNMKLNQVQSALIQVCINILKNSYDVFTLEDSNNIIFVSSKEDNHGVIILIKDTAGGIEKSIINRIFEPYFTTRHKSQGTGIGLYMCKEIIEKQMRGTISVENKSFIYDNNDYKGAEFTISFPI